MRRVLKIAGVVLLSAVILLLAASAFVAERYADRIVTAASAPLAPVAMVFGAGLEGGEPSPILAERLDTAVALYKEGKARTLLVSGDSSDRHHDEAKAMKRYAVERGVKPEHVTEDPAGISTYDACFRAGSVYGVKRALLVTQGFHLPRALFIAESLGIDAWGVPAGEGHKGRSPYEIRELFSRPLALLMVTLKPMPR